MLTVEGCSETARFDLTTRDSYFIIVAKVFSNRILAEDISFTNDVEWTEHKITALKPGNKY